MSEQPEVIVQDTTEVSHGKPRPESGLSSPMSLVFSFFCSASSTAPLSVPNPASQNGPWNVLTVMIVLAILYGWPCILIAQHMRPYDDSAIDTICNDRYPKWKIFNTIFSRISSLIIMLCADIALFMFVDAAMMNIIFNQFSKTIGRQYLVFLPAAGVWLMSLINNPKIFVILTSYAAVGSLINFISVIVYAATKTTGAKAAFYRDQWGKPGKYFPWSEGGATGVGNWCVLAGVLSMSFFIHNFPATILCTNSKPETNVAISAYVFIALGIFYWLIGVIGALPFADALAPFDRLSADVQEKLQRDFCLGNALETRASIEQALATVHGWSKDMSTDDLLNFCISQKLFTYPVNGDWSNAPFAPGNFLNALAASHDNIFAINNGLNFPTKEGYYAFSTCVYGLQCFCTLPLLYRVTRDACVGWFDMKAKFGSKWSFLVNACINTVIVFLSAFAQAYGMSLQVVMAIGGFCASCAWVIGIPVAYDIAVNKGKKNWILRTSWNIFCALFLLLILILQYCLPNHIGLYGST